MGSWPPCRTTPTAAGSYDVMGGVCGTRTALRPSGAASRDPRSARRAARTKGGRAMSIESVKAQVEPELMKLPNVIGCGIGEKEGRQVIKVFVTAKVPEEQLDPEAVVPKR